MKTKFPQVADRACCYPGCPEEGFVHIGVNGGSSHWICFRHLDRWNQTRARLLAAGIPCEMQELGELLCEECWDQDTDDDANHPHVG